MARYRVTISGPDQQSMLDLVRKHGVNVLDHGVRVGATETFRADAISVDAIVDGSDIPPLETAGYIVVRHEDIDKAGAERQREVGRGNRYAKKPEREE